MTRREKIAKDKKEGNYHPTSKKENKPNEREFTVNLFKLRQKTPRPNPTLTTSVEREDGVLIIFPPSDVFEAFDELELREFYKYVFVPETPLANQTICFTHLMEYGADYKEEDFEKFFWNAPPLFSHLIDKYFPGRLECFIVALQMRVGTMVYHDDRLKEMSFGTIFHNAIRENLMAYLLYNFKVAMGCSWITYHYLHHEINPDNMVDLWGNLNLEQWQKFCQPVFRFPNQRSHVSRFYGRDRDRPVNIWKIRTEINSIRKEFNEREKRIHGFILEIQSLERKLEKLGEEQEESKKT